MGRAEVTTGSGIYLMLSTDMSMKILPHFPLCIFTRFLLTSLIVVKLLRQRRRLQENFEDSPEGPIRPYTSLIHILIQSYALHASVSILFLGLYLARNSAWRIVLPNSVQAGVRRSSISYRLNHLPFLPHSADVTPSRSFSSGTISQPK